MSTAEYIFGYTGGLILLGVLVWISIALHLAYTKIDLILTHLKNCPAIMVRAPLRHGGPWGKLLLVGGISGIITFPNFYLKRGELNADDLSKLPFMLRRKLLIMHWSVILLLSAAFILWVIGKIVGWHH